MPSISANKNDTNIVYYGQKVTGIAVDVNLNVVFLSESGNGTLVKLEFRNEAVRVPIIKRLTGDVNRLKGIQGVGIERGFRTIFFGSSNNESGIIVRANYQGDMKTSNLKAGKVNALTISDRKLYFISNQTDIYVQRFSQSTTFPPQLVNENFFEKANSI